MKDAVLLAMASLNASAFADGPVEIAPPASAATAPTPTPIPASCSEANRVAREIVTSVLRGSRAGEPRRASEHGSELAGLAQRAARNAQEDRSADDASAT